MMTIISILPNDGPAGIYKLHIAATISAVHSCGLAMLGVLLAALCRNHCSIAIMGAEHSMI